MVPLLINKDVFEPSDDYLKFMNQNHNSFWMSQTHLLISQAQLSYMKLNMELRTARAVGSMATLSNKKSTNSQINSSAIASLPSMHKGLHAVH